MRAGFVSLILCVSSARRVRCVSQKQRRERLIGGYRLKTCNLSALDKSISDTNTITSRYTLLGFLCVSLLMKSLMRYVRVYASVSVCVAERGEEGGGGGWRGLRLIAEGD